MYRMKTNAKCLFTMLGLILNQLRFLRKASVYRTPTQKPGSPRSQALPGNAYPEAPPRPNPPTNPRFPPLLKPHHRQNIRVIL